jgi:peptide chain release factor 3
VPIITFVNKLDREARDPFDLLDEIEQSLALDVTPASWPTGMGRNFLGTYDLFADALLLFERGVNDRVTKPVRCSGLDDPKLPRLLPKAALVKLREEVEMAKGLCPPFDPQAYREGHLNPVFFGSALNNFGCVNYRPGLPRWLRGRVSRSHPCGNSKADTAVLLRLTISLLGSQTSTCELA